MSEESMTSTIVRLNSERDALKARMELDQMTAAEVAQNYEAELAELRAKLAALDTDLAKALVALDNEVAHKTIQRLRAEKAEAKLDASERACASMRAALAPFAATEPTGIGSIPRDKLWLWKPSRTGQDPPGISIAHIDAAKAAICSEAGRDYVHRSEWARLGEALKEQSERWGLYGDASQQALKDFLAARDAKKESAK